jgi:hypothetical protein
MCQVCNLEKDGMISTATEWEKMIWSPTSRWSSVEMALKKQAERLWAGFNSFRIQISCGQL